MENKKINPQITYSEPAEYFPKELRKKYKLGEYAENEELKKLKAVMLGHAVADALGVPVEFCERKELDEYPVTNMRGWGSHPVPAGCWSDDTSMSLAALDSLRNGRVDFEDIFKNFDRWIEKGEYTATGTAFDVGRTCMKAIRNHTVSKLPALKCGETSECSNGNGSLMRIHPFVLYAKIKLLNGTDSGHWLWMECIKAASKLTHAHERSIMGCYIYGYCLSFLLEKASRESLLAGIKFAGDDLDYLPEFEHYKRIFEPDFDKLSRDEIKSSGYVVDTLEAALWCVLTTDSYRDCVLKAVNLGEDTDTVAAVAGGLAGALYGIDAIPCEWLDALIKRDYIEKMCDDAYDAWTL